MNLNEMLIESDKYGAVIDNDEVLFYSLEDNGMDFRMKIHPRDLLMILLHRFEFEVDFA